MPTNKVFIACSSCDIDEKYKKETIKVAKKLINYDLIIGGYDKGQMKVVYDLFKANNRNITVVTPKTYELNNIKNVATTIDATKVMLTTCDLIVILPGGFGTIQELFSALQMKKSKEIDVPIIIYNVYGFYDDILAMIDKIYENKFAIIDESLYRVVDDLSIDK